jgi:cytochrome c oxidase subunit III
MTVTLVFLLVIAGIAGWWLSHQRLMSKPWLEQGLAGAVPHGEAPRMPTAKIGLGVFLAVVGALFALFASAYFMRMESLDWQSPPMPPLLWLNTSFLVASSVALHFAVSEARRGERATTQVALLTGGFTAVAFLVGQLLAWREFAASGYLLSGNAANSFFYLLTGMHGLHILGGLAGLARTIRTWTEADNRRSRLNIELCATYWHFLLFVWVALLVLLVGWANDFIDICRQLLT